MWRNLFLTMKFFERKDGSERTMRKDLLLLLVALSLSAMSLYSFFNAYQLWAKNQKAAEFSLSGQIHSSTDYINIVYPAIEAYERFFPVYLLGGLLFLASAMILARFRMRLVDFFERKPDLHPRHLVFLAITMTPLFLSLYFLYNAYQLWSKYKEVMWASMYPMSLPQYLDFDKYAGSIIEAYNSNFSPYLLNGLMLLTTAFVLMFQIKLAGFLDQKPRIQPKRLKRHLAFLIITLTLAILSLYSFSEAHQLWSKYQEVITPRFVPYFLAIDYAKHVQTVIDAYYQHFFLYLFYGLVFLVGVIIVPMIQAKLIYVIDESKLLPKLQFRTKQPVLGVVVSVLLIISGVFFCGAYNLWSNYQGTTDILAIEAYEKWFLAYLLGGLAMTSLASSIIVTSLRKRKTFALLESPEENLRSTDASM